MDTSNLLAGLQLGDLNDLTGMAEGILPFLPASDALTAAEKALTIVSDAQPPQPVPGARPIITDLADLMVGAALRGEQTDLLTAALERVARHDGEAVAWAAHRLAVHNVRRNLTRTVVAHSAAAYREWTVQAKALGKAYGSALAGEPYPDTEQALRAGGKAKARLEKLEEIAAEYAALAAAWKQMRMLVGRGQDRTVHQLSARYDRLPEGRSLEAAEREAKLSGLDALGFAAQHGLLDALVLDSATDATAREERWAAEAAERNSRQTLVGATNLRTTRRGDTEAVLREGVLSAGNRR